METKVQFTLFIVIFSINLLGFNSAPLTSSSEEINTDISIYDNGESNSTDLYVIRAVVYEVGILTDGDNSTENSEESHEEIDLKFFDPDRNGSRIDLSKIPVPVQTNVSGHVITGLAPMNLGSIQLPIFNDGDVNETDPMFQPPETNSTAYPLHNALLSVVTNLSTTNDQTENKILQGLPPFLDLPQKINNAISNSSDF